MAGSEQGRPPDYNYLALFMSSYLLTYY